MGVVKREFAYFDSCKVEKYDEKVEDFYYSEIERVKKLDKEMNNFDKFKNDEELCWLCDYADQLQEARSSTVARIGKITGNQSASFREKLAQHYREQVDRGIWSN